MSFKPTTELRLFRRWIIADGVVEEPVLQQLWRETVGKPALCGLDYAEEWRAIETVHEIIKT